MTNATHTFLTAGGTEIVVSLSALTNALTVAVPASGYVSNVAELGAHNGAAALICRRGKAATIVVVPAAEVEAINAILAVQTKVKADAAAAVDAKLDRAIAADNAYRAGRDATLRAMHEPTR